MPDIAAHYREIDPLPLVFALALSALASWFTFLAFARLLPAFRVDGYRLREVAHLYFTAQLLKHLPGRVWGVGYQWAAAERVVSLGSWVQVNIMHMVFATYFALWSSAFVLSFFADSLSGMAVLVLGAVGCLLLWGAPRVIAKLPWIGPLVVQRFGAESVVALAAIVPADKLRILALFAVSWLLLYTSWYANGMAYAPLGGIGGMRMCAYYMIAWFVGYISLLTPSGLGVRELIFAWLAQDFPNEAIVLMAVVGRVSLMAVDLLLGLSFAPFRPRSSSES